MYKIIDVKQGSLEWFEARLGKFTASNFAKVLSPTGKVSTQITGLINTLVAENLTGEKDETYKSVAMERGNELEDEAREFLNFTYGYNFKPVGFVDSGLGWGCSPDALDLDKNMGAEIKVPIAKTHIGYLRANKLPNDYITQVQGSMLVTGFKKWAFLSYHPLLKPLAIIVERDDDYINKLKDLLISGCLDIKRLTSELTNE